MRPNPDPVGNLERIARSCGAVVAIMAATIIVCRAIGWGPLAPIVPYLRMGTNTAFLLLLVGGTLVIWSRRTSSRLIRYCTGGAVLFSMILSIATLIDLSSNHALCMSCRFLRIPVLLGVKHGSHMALTTACGFLLVGAALLLLMRRVAAWAAFLGILVIVLGWVNLTAYWFEAPPFSSAITIPMAFSSALAFMALGVGIVAAAGPHAWPLSVLSPSSTSSSSFPHRWVSKGPAAIFLLLCVMIGAGGYPLIKSEYVASRRKAWDELNAIADLKVRQISRWYADQVAHAQFIIEEEWITKLAEGYAADQSVVKRKAQLLRRLSSIRSYFDCSGVLLLDRNLSALLCVPPEKQWGSSNAKLFAEEAMSTRRVVVSDLQRNKKSGAVGLNLFVPLIYVAASSTLVEAPVGVLEIEIDPNEFLFPTIQSWPTPSKTAESLLVRREENEVVYLNELRHRVDTALTLRAPIDRSPNLPSAMVLAGKEGIVEGVDYRGVPVLAALRKIPGTPWFLEAKVDQAEVYGPLRKRIVSIGVILLVLIFMAAMGVGLLQRRRDHQWLVKELESRHERQELADRILYLNKHANDIILLTDDEGRILEANNRAVEAYGYSMSELQGMFLRDLLVEEAQAQLNQSIVQDETADGVMYETVQRRKDGSPIFVESSIRMAQIGEHKYWQAIIRDISERKQSEARLRQREAELAVIFNSTPIATVVVDKERRVRSSNGAAQELAGRLSSELEGTRPGEALRCLHALDDPRGCGFGPNCQGCTIRTTVLDTLQAGRPHHDVEAVMTFVREGKEEDRYLLVSSVPLKTVEGEMALVTFDDITERKRTELLLAKALGDAHRREAETAALFRASRSIVECHTFEQSARVIFDTCKDLIGATSGYVALLSADGSENEVLFLDSGGQPCSVDQSLPMPIRGLRADAYKTGRAVHENNFASSQWQALMPAGHVGLDNVMFAPLIISDKVVGLLGLANKPGGFTEQDAGLATAFGELAALALHNSRAEEALRESEARYRAIFEDSPMSIWEEDFSSVKSRLDEIRSSGTTDLRAYLDQNPEEVANLAALVRVIEVNQASVEVLGAKSMEQIPRELNRYFAAESLQSFKEEVIALDDGRTQFSSESSMLDALGNPIVLELTLCVPRGYEDTLSRVLVSFVDITDRKRAEVERVQLMEAERAARADAERANRMKDEFLATASHELRNPLNGILGWAQLLSKGIAKHEDLIRGLDIIQRNARAQAQLVEDLLDVSRMVSGKMRLDVRAMELPAVIESAFAAVEMAAREKGIHLHHEIEPQASELRGDPGRLQQVVWNLLSNAIKFTPKDGRISVVVKRVGSNVEIRVSDTGEGIPQEMLSQIFDRFRQADSSITRKHGGLGIGLSIVKHVVEMHGGFVWAESEGANKGATFVVMLPLAGAGKGREPVALEDQERQARMLSDYEPTILAGVRVLVVDDDADTCELVGRYLHDYGAQVGTATSARQGLALLASFKPDVLLSDIGMPEQDGYEFIREIRTRPPEEGGTVPAVAMTAFARPEDRNHAMTSGFQLHLAKPVEPVDLISVVANLMGRNGKTPTEQRPGDGEQAAQIEMESEVAADAPRDSAVPQYPVESVSSKPVTILLAEDNAVIAEMLKFGLESRGFKVLPAAGVAQGVQIAARESIDLLLSDLRLTDGMGWELMAKLRETRLVPGIMMSGYSDDIYRRKAKEAGFQEYLVKPVDDDMLFNYVAKVLNKPVDAS